MAAALDLAVVARDAAGVVREVVAEADFRRRKSCINQHQILVLREAAGAILGRILEPLAVVEEAILEVIKQRYLVLHLVVTTVSARLY